MSLSFWTNAKKPEVIKTDPCLCAQMAPRWVEAFQTTVKSSDLILSVQKYASPDCSLCGGKGFESYQQDDSYNVHNQNGRALLGAFGFNSSDEGWGGKCSIPEIRRAIIRANNINLNRYTSGHVQEVCDRVILSSALDEETLRNKIYTFSLWLEEEIKQGATELSWG